MNNDYEIYVDPEEDEVFFGCVTEKERIVRAKLLEFSGSSPRSDGKLDKADRKGSDDGINEPITTLIEVLPEVKSDSVVSHEIKNSFDKIEKVDLSKNMLNKTSVKLEHNYSTPKKHKIDKSILATPKSIVKADKDGGFLKVLSEIALVKAEAEGEEKIESKDEDKENKIISPIPEIKITEATPEKKTVVSPPKSIDHELRRFRIIYNSPLYEDNKPKSFESERNLKNKCLDQNVEKWKMIDLIDFKDVEEPEELNSSIILKDKDTVNDLQKTNDENDSVIILYEKSDREIVSESPKPDSKFSNNSSEPPDSLSSVRKPTKGLRFSKEARKVVEFLKKSAADDTLNFTIPEINLEEEDNSFFSFEPLSKFDETVVLETKLLEKPKTVEKDRQKQTPVVSQRKLQPIRYFSERKLHNQIGPEKCVRKLPLEEKRPATVEKVTNGGIGETNAVMSSRIPMLHTKNSKIPLSERVARTVIAKTTPSKMPVGKNQKNSKFNHIESPINAYIHNKPTSLVVNVKPEIKKGSLTKVWKSQTTRSGKKEWEKPQQNPNIAVKLPFVEYKSATPYKIEKLPESRLPRLAPTVMKLIGPCSPKVLRHEGRFHINTPRKQSSTENTIVADENEVSVVLSKPALKSNTIK